jgi:hypothetical protein
MKRRALVVIFGVLFLLMLVSCAEYQKQAATTGEQGILVWIAPSGKVVRAINSDGSALKYAPKDKDRIVGGRLAFLTEGQREPEGFLKKVNGKWQSAPIVKKGRKGAKEDIRQVVIAFVASNGRVLSITNLDGTRSNFSGGISTLRVMSVSGAIVRCYIAGIPQYSCPPCKSTCCP